MTARQETIVSLQYLRALAALLVVHEHATVQFPSLAVLLPPSFGSVGVDIFFVLSGFIMVLTTAGSAVTPGGFLLRRALRIVPLYWATTLLVAGLAWAIPQLFHSTDVSWRDLLQSLAFIPYWSSSHPGHAWPVAVPGWTLNCEMFFYALFAAALWFPAQARMLCLSAVFLALAGLGAAVGRFESAAGAVYTNAQMLEFLAGAWVAQAWIAGRLQMPWAGSSVLLVAGGFALPAAAMWEAGPLSMLAASVCILVGALHPRWQNLGLSALQRLGDASYSLYLTHLFALGAARWLWQRAFGAPSSTLSAQAFVFLGIGLSVLLALLVHRAFELPVAKWLQEALIRRNRRMSRSIASDENPGAQAPGDRAA